MKKIFIVIIAVLIICAGCYDYTLDENESDASLEVENNTDNSQEKNNEADDTSSESESTDNKETENQNNTEETINSQEDSQFYMWVIAEQGLNLREYPQINSEKIVLMPYDSKVILINDEKVKDTIDKVKGNWVRVKYNDVDGWAFDAYLDFEESKQVNTEDDIEEDTTFIEIENNIIKRNIAEGDTINGLEVVEVIEYSNSVSQIEIKFTGKMSITGELVRREIGAALIPDKQYSNILPILDGGNEIYYIELKNFENISDNYDLEVDVDRVRVELSEYMIDSSIGDGSEIPQYSAKLLNISGTDVIGTNGYEGKIVEGCYITDKLQLKDTICGLKVVRRTFRNDEYDSEGQHYIGSVWFEGEMTLNVSYQYYDDEYLTGYHFKVLEEDHDKIPHFKDHDIPSFEVSNINEEIKEQLGKLGIAEIKVNDYNYYWLPKEQASTAELVEIISVEKGEDF